MPRAGPKYYKGSISIVWINENRLAVVSIMQIGLLSWKYYLVGTWDRAYSFVNASLAALSIMLTIVLWQFPEKVPILIIIRDIVVVCVLLLTSGLLLYKYMKRESYLTDLTARLQASNDRLNKQFGNFHSVVHKYRNDVFRRYLDKVPEEIVVTEIERDTFERICHSLTMDVKKIFFDYLESRNIYLKDDLCVAVKLTLSLNNIIELYGRAFDEDIQRKLQDNSQWVITVYRDPETYEKHRESREVGLRIYSIEKNTAFRNIAQDRQNIFASNDLLSLGSAYNNENPDWKSKYNAALVAPIRYSVPEKNEYRCFGFLAVDSLNAEKQNIFETEEAKCIIGYVVDLMATYFLVLSVDKAASDATLTNATRGGATTWR